MMYLVLFDYSVYGVMALLGFLESLTGSKYGVFLSLSVYGSSIFNYVYFVCERSMLFLILDLVLDFDLREKRLFIFEIAGGCCLGEAYSSSLVSPSSSSILI